MKIDIVYGEYYQALYLNDKLAVIDEHLDIWQILGALGISFNTYLGNYDELGVFDIPENLEDVDAVKENKYE